MKQLKTVIALAGVAGIVAAFLPYVSVAELGLSMSFWDIHKMPGGSHAGLLNGPNQVYVAFACFAIPMLMGLLALATKQLQRWEAIVASVFSLGLFAVEGVRKGLLGEDGVSTAYGGKLLFVAAAVMFVASLIGAIKPERNR